MSTILVKKNDTAGHVPDASDLTNSSGGAELAVNTADGKLYVKNSSGEIVTINKMKKIAQFPSSGTWTVPAGVTYAIAHITSGGGGGANETNNATAGGDSSVGFASGTVSSVGGYAMAGRFAGYIFKCLSGRANTGESATIGYASGFAVAVSSTEKVHGASVTPAEEITVTVGAGGTQGSFNTGAPGPGTANGGSGYVWIEYYE